MCGGFKNASAFPKDTKIIPWGLFYSLAASPNLLKITESCQIYSFEVGENECQRGMLLEFGPWIS